MSAKSTPVFGKRKPIAVRSKPAALVDTGDLTRLPPAYASFFAAARMQVEAGDDGFAMREVPLSGRAALLSGLVVGCALAGFDATGNGYASASQIAKLTGFPNSAVYLVPALIVLGLFGGARTTALTIVVVHNALRAVTQTSFAAYALGGLVATLILAAAIAMVVGHAPSHGWVAELAAGAASGMLYRAFAGTKRP